MSKPIIDSPKTIKRLDLFAIRTGVYPSVQEARLFVPAPGMWALHNAAPLTKGESGIRGRAQRACGRNWHVVRYWLSRYKMLEWFRDWLLTGQDAPDSVRIVTDLQAGRSRKAWDWRRFCQEVASNTKRDRLTGYAYYEWMSKKGLDSRVWRSWLYGGPVPRGCFVISEALLRVRHERGQKAICEAASINYETYRKCKRDPRIVEAIEAACEAVSAPGHPSRRGIGDGLGASVLKLIWAYAESARENKCLERANISNSGYNHALQDAERIGVKDILLDFLRGADPWVLGKMRFAGFLVPGKLLAPSPLMIRFRSLARRAAAENKISGLRSLAGFWEWFDDWTNPHSWIDGFQTADGSEAPKTDNGSLRPADASPQRAERAAATPVLPSAQTNTLNEASEGIEWSEPLSPSELAKTFDVHYNTMIQWLRKGVILNRQVTPRRYRVAKSELPN